MGRYLILSDDERTWKFDQPVIFLGDWCRRYDRKHVWSKMDAIVAKPYGVTIEERVEDYQILQNFKHEIYPKIFNLLNEVHQVKNSNRFWQILVGDWLIRYIDVIYNRVRTLQQCLENYEICGVSLISNSDYVMAPSDSLSSVMVLDDDYWNLILYEKIFKITNFDKIHIEYIIDSKVSNLKNDEIKDQYFTKQNFYKVLLIKIYNYCTKFLRNKNDALIINSYLPKKTEILIHLAMGQMPQLWPLNKPKLNCEYSSDLRAKLKFNTSFFDEPALNTAFGELLLQLMPISYVEGYKSLENSVNALQWPKYPKLIFTSNNHDCDDIFKLYAAKKTEFLGVPYYIGVHGSGYFKYYDNPGNFELVSDKCLTWGFTHGLKQHVPAFIFTTVNSKGFYDKLGGLLLTQVSRYSRDRTWDVYEDIQLIFNKQINFFQKLDADARRNLIIRLHPFSKYLKWFEYEKWMSYIGGEQIDNGQIRLEKLISKSRLVVHGYDSTGLAETLSLNIPTLAILQIGVDQLNDLSKIYYQALIDVGIVHSSPESAALKVNEIWNDVEGWWNLSTVQDARLLFCNQYGRRSEKPVRDLKKILLNGMF
jgi:putative transferase (TIGR04331 family)